MNAGIYTNIYKDANLAVTQKLISSLNSYGINCYAHESLSGKVKCAGFFSENGSVKIDMLFAIGGDGTLLSISKWCAAKNIPILGVNLGKMGFLTEAEPNEIDSLARDISEGKYCVDKRTMLCARVGDKEFYALNEVVISRRAVSKMIMLKVTIEGAPVDKYYCDGLIVCTPTGSTAYSLSAGGPVISPHAGVFSVTPLNSHSMHSRPVVVGDDEVINITLAIRAGDAIVLADGKEVCALIENQSITISKAERRALFVRLNNANFYERLLRKLNSWSITPHEED